MLPWDKAWCVCHHSVGLAGSLTSAGYVGISVGAFARRDGHNQILLPKESGYHCEHRVLRGRSEE